MSESTSVLVAEVPISAHSIVLSHGTYCVFVIGVTQGLAERDLPALRISSSPGSATVAVAALPGDGWLRHLGDAVLLRVASERSRVLFTSYDESRVAGAKPPQIQIQRLDDGRLPESMRPSPGLQSADYKLHFSRRGDVPAAFGEWIGTLGDDSWIEGIELTAPAPLAASDLEYQVVLGRGWLSPWVQAGEFCGSRGMGLPILGFRARLLGLAAQQWRLRYAGKCVDGRELPEAEQGMPCESADLTPLAAMNIKLEPIGGAPSAAMSPPKSKKTSKTAPSKTASVRATAKSRRATKAI
jgi:hypothetical protein